jgi:hypothetical protein
MWQPKIYRKGEVVRLFALLPIRHSEKIRKRELILKIKDMYIGKMLRTKSYNYATKSNAKLRIASKQQNKNGKGNILLSLHPISPTSKSII